MKYTKWLVLFAICALTLVNPAGFAHAQETPTPITDGAVLELGAGKIPAGKNGQKLAITIPLINTGNAEASQIMVTPKPSVSPEHFPFEITSTSYTVKVPESIAAGKQLIVELGEFTLRKELITGYYAMPLSIQYQSGSDQRVIEKALFIKVDGLAKPEPEPNGPGPITINVPDQNHLEAPMPGGGDFGGGDLGGPPMIDTGGGSSSASGSVPRVMLVGFKTDPVQVTAGKEFNLEFTLQNMSSSTAVSNMRVTITSAESSFLPVAGAASVYVDSLGAKAGTTHSLKFKALPNLEEMPYQLVMNIEYEANGAPATAEEVLAVSVRQEARVEVPNLEVMPESIVEGDYAAITFAINNRGKNQLYNTSVKIKEDPAFKAKENFLGNIAPGSSMNADLMVEVAKQTKNPIVVQIVYEDAYGSSFTIEKKINIEIMKAEDLENNSEGDDAEPAASPLAGILPLAILLLIVLGIVGAVLLARKRKAKKQAEQAEHLEALDPEPIFTDEPRQ